MKPLKADFPLAFQTSQCRSADFPAGVLVPLGCCAIFFHRRSQIHRAIALIKNRAEICAPTLLAALLFACIPAAQASNLGRLFYTPEQRAQLDYSYARNAPVEGNSSPVLTVNGIVQKNGGARTVWVNGVSQNAGHSGERTPSAQTVTIPGKSRPVKIKVGDRILLDQSAPPGQPTAAE